MKPETRCTNCMEEFEDDEDLEFLMDDPKDIESGFRGCPNCKTDAYLMDLIKYPD